MMAYGPAFINVRALCIVLYGGHLGLGGSEEMGENGPGAWRGCGETEIAAGRAKKEGTKDSGDTRCTK